MRRKVLRGLGVYAMAAGQHLCWAYACMTGSWMGARPYDDEA